MVKMKRVLISTVVICAFAGAFASNYRIPCESMPQYYKFGNSYYPAGTYGLDYICTSGAGNCTWYQPNPYDQNTFAPCKTGTFTYAFLKK
jgi:hypothetical protein